MKAHMISQTQVRISQKETIIAGAQSTASSLQVLPQRMCN